MKNYVVLRVYETINPSVVFACNDEQDAKDFARLMSRQDNYSYEVAKVLGPEQ